MPYLCYVALRKSRLEDKFPFVSVSLITLLNILLWVFFIFNDHIYSESGRTSYELYPWLKITISIVIALYLLNKKYKDKRFTRHYKINLIACSVFLTYFVFKIPVGSAVQAFILDWEFLIILTVRMLTGFVTSFVHIFLISVALDVSLNFNVEGALLNNETFFHRLKKNIEAKK